MPRGSDELDAAVSKQWQELWDPPGGMATKWFLVVEGVDAEGDRWIDFVWPENLKTWDVKGLLYEALDSQVAGMVADELREED